MYDFYSNYNYVDNNGINNIDMLGLDKMKIDFEFYDGFYYMWIGRFPTNSGWVDYYEQKPLMRKFEFEIEYTKKCKGLEASITDVRIIKSNLIGRIDQYGLSVLIVGYTVSWKTDLVVVDFNSYNCPKGYGNIKTYDFSIIIEKKYTLGFNPGIGYISFDFGASFSIFKSKKWKTKPYRITQKCCCE